LRMVDLVYLLLIVGFFAATVKFADACEGL
jgi:hypothetical protein